MPELNEPSVTIAQEVKSGVFYANCIIDSEHTFLKFVNVTNENVYLPENFQPVYKHLSESYICSKVSKKNLDENRQQQLQRELNLSHLDLSIRKELEKVCVEYNDVFSLTDDPLTFNNFYEQKN